MINFLFTFVTHDDYLDWKNYGVENLINTVVNHKHLGNGSIILCHNGAKYTAQALDNMIKNVVIAVSFYFKPSIYIEPFISE